MQYPFKKLKIYLLLTTFIFPILGCGKSQKDSKNLKPNISFTQFQFAVTAPKKNSQNIANWRVDTQLKCPGIIVRNRTYSIDKVFTSNGKETIDFPTDEYNCTLTIKSFELDGIRYNPKNKNSAYILTKQNKPITNYGSYQNNHKTAYKFISGKINNDKFSLHIFEKIETAALFNDIDLSFSAIDEQYSRFEIQNNSPSDNIEINKIDSSNLINEHLSIQSRTEDMIDSKYGDFYQCSDSIHEPIRKIIKHLPSGSRCAIVIKTENNQFGIHTSNMSIKISDIEYNFSITNKIFLYLTGNFTLPCKYIAQYDGSELSCLTTQITNPGQALFQTPNGNLYVGTFYRKNTNDAALYKWDGKTIYPIKPLLNSNHTGSGKINSLAITPDESLIFAGLDYNKNSSFYNTFGLALFQNENWRSIGTPTGSIFATSFSHDFSRLYIGGNFRSIFNIPSGQSRLQAISIAQLNNVNDLKKELNNDPKWSSMGRGFQEAVHSILPLQNNKIAVAGKSQNNLANQNISQLAIWDNNNLQWSGKFNTDLNSGSAGSILTMKSSLDGNDLFIGGQEERNKLNFNKFARFSELDSLGQRINTWSRPIDQNFPLNSLTKAIAISPNGKTVYTAGRYLGVQIPNECKFIMGYKIINNEMTRFCLPLELNTPSLNGSINALELKNIWSASINDSLTTNSPTVFLSKNYKFSKTSLYFISDNAAIGPTNGIWESYTPSTLTIPIVNEKNNKETINIILKASKLVENCRNYSMNSGLYCGINNNTKLQIDFNQNDNLQFNNLPIDNSYNGQFHIFLKNWHLEESVNIKMKFNVRTIIKNKNLVYVSIKLVESCGQNYCMTDL